MIVRECLMMTSQEMDASGIYYGDVEYTMYVMTITL